jgi:excisionase family DNA binding protein
MSTEQLMRRLLTATPSELKKIEAVFTGEGATDPGDRRLLSIAQAAVALGVSRTTIWRLLRDGRLPCVELRPGSRRIPSAAVTEFARRGVAQ